MPVGRRDSCRACGGLGCLGLIAFDADPANLQPMRFLGILAVGVLYDAAALAYLLMPFALLASLVPGRDLAGNGYTVIDRGAIAKEDISHETIWGVADEDLFRLAIRELDSRTSAGHRVFAHVMTTSNHRPFTYPEGRIDIASGTGRDGAVKYSDWAIGEFMREASARPWFRDTLFVCVADHTSHGRGRTDLPPENYRVPLIIYAPGTVAPGRVDRVASQIDVAPTVLALLNQSYTSQFFDQDILTEGVKHPRALMASYLTVGYMERGVVVELSPKRRATLVDAVTGKPVAAGDPRGEGLVDEAIAYYQVATQVLRGHPRAAGEQTAQAPARIH